LLARHNEPRRPGGRKFELNGDCAVAQARWASRLDSARPSDAPGTSTRGALARRLLLHVTKRKPPRYGALPALHVGPEPSQLPCQRVEPPQDSRLPLRPVHPDPAPWRAVTRSFGNLPSGQCGPAAGPTQGLYRGGCLGGDQGGSGVRHAFPTRRKVLCVRWARHPSNGGWRQCRTWVGRAPGPSAS